MKRLWNLLDDIEVRWANLRYRLRRNLPWVLRAEMDRLEAAHDHLQYAFLDFVESQGYAVTESSGGAFILRKKPVPRRA